MKFVKLFLLLTSLFLASFSSAEDVVAQVGNKKITLDEFNKKYNEVKAQSINPPTKNQFLEDLVRYEVGIQEAEKRNLRKDPIVQDRFDQEMYKALLEKDLGMKVQKITISDKDMRDWYKNNPEIRTSHILIELKPDATDAQKSEAEKRAKEILSEVKKSKRPFEELVKLYSDDSISKQSGGDVGFQSKVTLVPTYYDAILNAKVGEIIGLVPTIFGFHIIKVTGRRDFQSANKRQIRAAVFDEKRREIFDDYFDKLKKSYSIKVNSSAIR